MVTLQSTNIPLSVADGEAALLKVAPARVIDFSAALTIARNSLRVSLRYPANFIIWGVMPILWLLPFVFTGIAFSGGITSAQFGGQTGYANFIPYLALGWVVFSYVDSAIWGVGNTLRWYQFAGVLEPMFLIPAPRLSILLGAAMAELVTTSMSTIILFGLSVLIFNLQFALTAVLPILLLLFLMIVAFTGFAFAFSGLILVFKDPSVLTQFVHVVIYTLTPVNYSVSVLPSWVQPLSLILPSTFAIIGIREAALAAAGIALLWGDVMILLLLVVIFWITGILVFRLAEWHTRKKGKMGAF
ncbi:MAG: ABC transporter permease [Promethearchaeota archaeon]